MNAPTKYPIRKITAVGASSLIMAIIIVLAWILHAFFPEFEMDAEVKGAISLILLTVIPPMVGYYVRSNPGDFNHRATLKKDGK